MSCYSPQTLFEVNSVCSKGNKKLVLDTKWKLIDGSRANGADNYGLAQTDFYQTHTYGQGYLDSVRPDLPKDGHLQSTVGSF